MSYSDVSNKYDSSTDNITVLWLIARYFLACCCMSDDSFALSYALCSENFLDLSWPLFANGLEFVQSLKDASTLAEVSVFS